MSWAFFSLVVLLSAYLGDKVNNPRKYIYFRLLLVLALSYLIGMSGIVSTDHDEYAAFYNNLKYLDFKGFLSVVDFNFFSDRITNELRFEIGYASLNYICSLIGLSEAAFFLIVATITNALFVSFFYRYKHPVFSVLLYITSMYYLQEINLVRQMLAVSVFLYSIKYIEQKNLIMSIIFVIIAASIHASSLLLLPFCFIVFTDFNKETKVFSSVLLALWIFSIFVALGLVFFDVGGFIEMSNFYEGYSNDRLENDLVFDIMLNIVVVLSFIGLLIKKLALQPIIIFTIVGAVLSNISLSFYILFRYALYFTPCFCVAAPIVLSCYNQIHLKGKLTFPAIIVFAYHLYILATAYIWGKPLLGSKMYSFTDLFV